MTNWIATYSSFSECDNKKRIKISPKQAWSRWIDLHCWILILALTSASRRKLPSSCFICLTLLVYSFVCLSFVATQLFWFLRWTGSSASSFIFVFRRPVFQQPKTGQQRCAPSRFLLCHWFCHLAFLNLLMDGGAITYVFILFPGEVYFVTTGCIWEIGIFRISITLSTNRSI